MQTSNSVELTEFAKGDSSSSSSSSLIEDVKNAKPNGKDKQKNAQSNARGGDGKNQPFKIIKKGMMKVENINKLIWYKNTVSFTTWVTTV